MSDINDVINNSIIRWPEVFAELEDKLCGTRKKLEELQHLILYAEGVKNIVKQYEKFIRIDHDYFEIARCFSDFCKYALDFTLPMDKTEELKYRAVKYLIISIPPVDGGKFIKLKKIYGGYRDWPYNYMGNYCLSMFNSDYGWVSRAELEEIHQIPFYNIKKYYADFDEDKEDDQFVYYYLLEFKHP